MLDHRFLAMFDPEAVHRAEMFQYALEDFIVTEYLDPPNALRVPAALEALRVARFVDLRESPGLDRGPPAGDRTTTRRLPAWTNPQGAPKYGVRLTAIKGFHRLCDGVRTVYVVDRQGDLGRAVDISRWADRTQGSAPPRSPCPRAYGDHARATRDGGHVCLVLTPSQEIKVFAGGEPGLLLQRRPVAAPGHPHQVRHLVQGRGGFDDCRDLAGKVFQAALNLGEDRKGALFVVLRDPAASIPQLIAPTDRIDEEVAFDDDPRTPTTSRPGWPSGRSTTSSGAGA